jgi:putative ABC transport system substrate-binding protein
MSRAKLSRRARGGREETTVKFRAVGIITVVLSVLLASLAADAQQAGKVPRIGVVVPAEPASPEEPNIAAFRQALRDLGYLEGQTIAVEYRYAHGEAERYRDLAIELVQLKVDVLVVGSGQAVQEAQKATTTIPIVMAGAGDPVGQGLVASLTRPGGNVTGLSLAFAEGFSGKWVELLNQADPKVSHVAYLYHDPANPGAARRLKDLSIATQALGLQLQPLEVRELDQLDSAFAALSKEEDRSLIVSGEPRVHAYRSRITELAAKYRLPGMYPFRHYVDAGGLMSYGVSIADLWRRAAIYVDKILKGAKPADLPVEQPMRFELVINLKTAKALGLTTPPSLLFQADEVIR